MRSALRVHVDVLIAACAAVIAAVFAAYVLVMSDRYVGVLCLMFASSAAWSAWRTHRPRIKPRSERALRDAKTQTRNAQIASGLMALVAILAALLLAIYGIKLSDKVFDPAPLNPDMAFVVVGYACVVAVWMESRAVARSLRRERSTPVHGPGAAERGTP